jgi:hypothetical protein
LFLGSRRKEELFLLEKELKNGVEICVGIIKGDLGLCEKPS